MNVLEFECYKYRWIIQELQRAVNRVSSQVSDTARIERRALQRVGEYLATHEEAFRNKKHITRLIYQETAFAINHSRRELAVSFEEITFEDKDGQTVEYEPLDVLANVASGNLEIKETITLLAKDDRRKEFVLNAWANGYKDDTEISHILADVFTGQATGHLSFIKRFRKVCRTELTALAI